MKNVLAIIAAITLAAIVLSPAMGYTISSGANESYSISSTPVNYSISMGTPAHNITPGMIPSEVSPTSSVTVTRVPYSIKLGAAAPYSVKLGSAGNATPEGMQTAPQTVLLGSLAANKASSTPAPAPAPAPAPQNVTPPAPAPAPAPAKFSIMGMVSNNESMMGLAGWMINLEQPAGTVVANTTTNSSGNYAFKSLNAGSYVVAEVLPAGWLTVNPADGKNTINLTKDATGVNFANKKMPVANVTKTNVTAANVTVPSNATLAVTPPAAPAVNATATNSTTTNSTAK